MHLLAPAAYGGAEAVVQALARQQGERATVGALVQSSEPSPFVNELREGGARVVEIRCGRRRYRREVSAVRAILRDSQADILHTHVYHADLVGYFAARSAGVPVVSTVHGFTGGDLKNRMYEWLDERALRRMSMVIAVSATVRDRLVRAGCAAERVRLIPNGYVGGVVVDRATARARLGIAAGECTVGWVGRMSHEKGADLLVEALSGLTPDVPHAVLIGGGDQAKLVARDVARVGIADRVRLAGEIPNAGALVGAFDLLVISSRTEGTPIILLEAMAAGVPVISFAVGGIPDVLGEGAGWLVAPGDTRGLGAAIRAAISDPSVAAERARRAAQILHTRYGTATWVGRINEVYEEVSPG